MPSGNPFAGQPKTDDPGVAINKDVEALLTPDQLKRLDQLVVQSWATDLLTVMSEPMGVFKPTPEQAKQLAAYSRELSDIARLIQAAALSGGEAPSCGGSCATGSTPTFWTR